MATQKGRNWSSGDIVTAANLSSIERGVSAVAEEYMPTTWANGDTVTAAGLNNIEQGIANAEGGGSSDLSTAQMTVINTAENTELTLMGVFIDTQANTLVLQKDCVYGTTTVTVVLYKGAAICEIGATEITSTTGDITLVEGVNYTISGDCTVTVKGFFSS